MCKGRKRTSLKGITLPAFSELPDFQIFLERPPLDQGDRWSARPFRHLAAVRPASVSFGDRSRASSDKQRFLHNLWSAQAVVRSKVVPPKPVTSGDHWQPHPPSALLDADRWTPEQSSPVTSVAQTYWNVWEAQSWNSEPRKVRLTGVISKRVQVLTDSFN